MRQTAMSSVRGQRGIVLIVCLVILLVMTIIGVNAMGTSTLQERMASNSQNAMSTFQAAESAIQETLADGDVFSTAINVVEGADRDFEFGSFAASTTTTSAGPPQIVEGYSIGTFASYPFAISAASDSDATGARSRQTLGVRRLAPAPN